MSRFEQCRNIVFGEEGGASNVAHDKGGLTLQGVTQATFSAYLQRLGAPDRPVTESTLEERSDIYQTFYWKPVHGDSLPAPLDLVVFDMAINSGPRQAIKVLQRALGVGDDGLIGPGTLGAIQEDVAAGQLQSVVDNFLTFRETFYRRLVDADPTQQRFLQGWLNRLAFLRKVVAAQKQQS